ncbi:MAG: hypothetical protein K8I29_00965 [Alphaproteobacteria bacterium]|uniref:Uncharacterized protein n=1 Tax=Candidatus Nitrobium versatile TaxID=2884831 RepID=A0A953J1Y8_9BACT|nr:hypothetical protein [Candidatus Nitrobium versatile]
MRISVIRSREQFERIREDWSAAYAADPEAAVFVSGECDDGVHIRYAIENGFRIYDFGAGGEKYKYSFGTQE